MASAAFGFSLIYAGLDQGNRLDWLGSDLVIGLLAGGGVLVVHFFVRELTTREPWIDVRMLAGGFLPLLLLLVCEVRFASLGTAYIVPQYLAVVRGFRPLETGSILLWIAVPQLVAVPFAVYLLRRVDPRWVAGTGIAMIAAACWFTADHLSAQWATDDFLATQLLQALGQTLALSAAIFTGVLYLKPAATATFGVTIQVARLLGGELGFATIVTFVRVSEQLASNIFGSHVQAGSLETLARLQALTLGIAGRSEGAGVASARAVGILSQTIRTQANLQACIDGFALIAASSVVAFVVLLAFASPPKGPASPTFLLARRRRVTS
jgi:DHA2 family multidrug resistance protein